MGRFFRGVRRLLVGVVVAILLVGLIGLPVYVFPSTDVPPASDAVFVLGPPTQTRIALATALVEQGVADTLVVSVPASGAQSAAQQDICASGHTFTVVCLTPDPLTTRGEAQLIEGLATERGWDAVTVVTFTPHVTRARVTLERCFPGTVALVADTTALDLGEWAYQYAYQTAAFVKLAVTPGC